MRSDEAPIVISPASENYEMDKRMRCSPRVFAMWQLIACILLASCSRVLALDPSLDINQYAHIAWRVCDGFAKGFIYAIAQTPDGYLSYRRDKLLPLRARSAVTYARCQQGMSSKGWINRPQDRPVPIRCFLGARGVRKWC